jgi:hypothetical protein
MKAPMDRRTLIRRLLGAAAAGGAVMTAQVIDAAPAPFLLVLEAPGPLPADTAERMRRAMSAALSGTAFGAVKVLILADGRTLKAISADGRILTQSATERARRKPRAAKPKP